MSDLITDEMVETAARAMYEAHGLTSWDKEGQEYLDLWRDDARSALEAVAPMIAGAALQSVRDALANHPRCEEHPDGDVISCGWKAAVLDVQRALDELRDRIARALTDHRYLYAETTTDLHWSNAAAAEYPGDEYEQYPLRTAFGRGVRWERKRAARKGIEQ